MIFPDGSCFKGEFVNGKPTGGGTFVSASGNLQKGSYSKIEAGEEEGETTGGEWTPGGDVAAAYAADLATTTVGDAPATEQTYGMIKPNAVAAGATEAILDQARAAGFKVVCQQVATLSKEQAEEFYGEHNGKPFFEALVTFMTSGPIWSPFVRPRSFSRCSMRSVSFRFRSLCSCSTSLMTGSSLRYSIDVVMQSLLTTFGISTVKLK